MILVAGGAGYIGSHACIELLLAGYNLVLSVFVNKVVRFSKTLWPIFPACPHEEQP